ncbi:MAG: hypothetical protein HWE26_01180 [Alteromonadaceae bacterium]|nr:hypothetical protein [Alteromonadaceae bacterium]
MKTTEKLGWRQQNRANRNRLAFWTFLWLVTLAVVYFGHRYIWQEQPVVTGLMIVVNVVIGFVMIWANKVMLNGLDELEQKIHLTAMGLSLGTGLVLGFAYSALSDTGLIDFEAQITHLAVVMSLTYLAGTFIGMKKYQ